MKASNTAVFQWQIYCESESKFVDNFFGPNPPTTCPNDTAHITTAGSVDKLNSFNNNETKIIEFQPDIGQKAILGYKRLQTVSVRNDDANSDILLPNTINKMTWISPVDPVIVQYISANSETKQMGDVVNLWVNKDKPSGVLAVDIQAGDVTLQVGGAVDYITPGIVTGIEVSIANSVTQEIFSFGKIIAINPALHTIEFEFPAPKLLLAAESIICTSIHTIDTVVFGAAGNFDFGMSSPNAIGYLAPRTPVTIWYENKHSEPVEWKVQLTLGYGTR